MKSELFARLSPDLIMDAIESLGYQCDARILELNSYENRVFQIGLEDAEPIIAGALSMPGTVVENVPALPGKRFADTDPQELDLTDSSITENTRFSYPLACNPNVADGARGGHPETIVLLTADAFGVLPPVSVLEGRDVMYHFVQGFTAKLAGTEVGVTEPQATFSACFGAPFMAYRPSVYAKLLREKMERSQTRCILLNTGWSGGPAGQSPRISIRDTRALLNAAFNGDLDAGNTESELHATFNLRMPKSCPGVDPAMLNPRNVWNDQVAYDETATKLRDMFRDNFDKHQFEDFGIEAVM